MRFFLMCMMVLLLFGCEQSERPLPKFDEGALVQSVVSDQRGQVISSYYQGNSRYLYKVRFQATQTYTDTSLLGKDGAIEQLPLATMIVEEFEIKKLGE